MPLYRAVHNLNGVCKRGELTRLTHLQPAQVEKLLQSGGVTEVLSPPLSELPHWESRAGKLVKIGVISIVDFLDADPAQIAETLRVKPDTVAGYTTELTAWLFVKE